MPNYVNLLRMLTTKVRKTQRVDQFPDMSIYLLLVELATHSDFASLRMYVYLTMM